MYNFLHCTLNSRLVLVFEDVIDVDVGDVVEVVEVISVDDIDIDSIDSVDFVDVIGAADNVFNSFAFINDVNKLSIPILVIISSLKIALTDCVSSPACLYCLINNIIDSND